MRNILVLLIITLAACSNPVKYEFEGRYKHTYSDVYFDLFKDGTYRYTNVEDSNYQKSFNGTWKLKNNTVYLKPYDFIFPGSTKVELLNKEGSNKTKISINLLGGYEKGQEPDTLRTMWYVSINGNPEFTSTDRTGKISIDKQYIDKIEIKDKFQYSGLGKLFRHKDSILHINSKADEINIFLSISKRYPSEHKTMPRKLLWKDNVLYPIDYIEDIEFLRKSNNYYKHLKLGS